MCIAHPSLKRGPVRMSDFFVCLSMSDADVTFGLKCAEVVVK